MSNIFVLICHEFLAIWTFGILKNIFFHLSTIKLDTKTISFRIPNVHLTRDDLLDIQKKILDVTPEDRKKLGINKSTLWYQKRHLARGKAIRVYGKMLNRLRS